MLIDTLELRGLSAIAQVDLGRRQHSHQDTAALGRMATQITHVVHQRAGGDRAGNAATRPRSPSSPATATAATRR